MGVSEIRAPYYSTLNIRILILGKIVLQILLGFSVWGSRAQILKCYWGFGLGFEGLGCGAARVQGSAYNA